MLYSVASVAEASRTSTLETTGPVSTVNVSASEIEIVSTPSPPSIGVICDRLAPTIAVSLPEPPVNVIPDAYYRLKRVADDFTIINYSTASTPSYSQLSYDASGSYFDLDMSILEPNYLYEISFLYKDGTSYIEQKEKFKFRVDP